MTGILPACDLCHARKVRCDRQERCANCADNGIECRRLRPMRLSKQKSPSDALSIEERIMNLERATSLPPGGSHAEVSPHAVSDTVGDPSKKRKVEREAEPQTTRAGNTESVTNPDDSTHYAKRAKAILQNELEGNENFSHERLSVLHSALKLVEKVAKTDSTEADGSGALQGTGDSYEDVAVPDAPPNELFYMLLHEPTVLSGASCVSIKWPDHIPIKTYEKMSTYLLDDNSRGQKFYHYSVCVYVKAIVHIYQFARVSENKRMKDELLKSKKVYVAAAISALGKLDILASPSLSLIQALISGALLIQYIGKMNQAWVLNSYAARLIVSLNYHEISDPTPTAHFTEEVHSMLYWCYYMDRTLSSLLIRMPSLPELPISPTELIHVDPALPYGPLIRIILDLCQVQGDLLDITLQGRHKFTSQVLATCERLQGKMRSLHLVFESGSRYESNLITCDYISLEFSYYAIFVDVLRCRLRYAPCPLVHQECLSYARASLKAFQHLQTHLSEMPGFNEPHPSFLAWTILLYPLSPFFVLFCNIIGTSNTEDYKLMQDITEGLSRFKESPYTQRMLSLLVALQRLCQPLFQDAHQAQPIAWGSDPQIQPQVTNGSYPDPNSTDNGAMYMGTLQEPATSLAPEGAHIAAGLPYTLADSDSLMWQLFNSHVSLEWIHPDSGPFRVD